MTVNAYRHGWKGLTLAAILAAGLGLPSVAAEEPAFRLEGFFDGASVSAGTITTLFFWTRGFTAEFSGEADGETIRLDERFDFEDGERLQRWALTREGDRYVGTVRTETGDGVLQDPVPVEGRILPSGIELDYVGYAPGGPGWLSFHFHHRMEPRPDGTVSNDVTVSKFHLPIATSEVIFAKNPEALNGL